MKALLVVLGLCVAVAVAGPPCSYSYSGPGGKANFDLSSLRRTSGEYKGGDAYFTYKMNICGSIPSTPGCEGQSICAWWKGDDTFYESFGSWEGSPAPEWSLLDQAQPAAGVALTFKNGKASCAGVTETVIVKLPCDPSQSTPPESFTASEDFASCTLTFVMPTKASCPGSGGGGSGSGGISGGSVFLILFFVFGFVYVAGGCFYNRRNKGATTMQESCPHYDFWCSIPSLAKDGCIFTWNKLRSLAGKGHSGYEETL